MRVTIIADASWCPDTYLGGYGFWIASERGKMPGEGVFKRKCNNSCEAEAMALVNALHVGIKNNLVHKGGQYPFTKRLYWCPWYVREPLTS